MLVSGFQLDQKRINPKLYLLKILFARMNHAPWFVRFLASKNLVVSTQNVVIWPSGQAFCVQIDKLFNLSVTHAQRLKNIMYFYRTYNTIYQNSASTDHFFEVYLLHLVYLEKLENIFARKCIIFCCCSVDYFFKVLCHIQHSCI